MIRMESGINGSLAVLTGSMCGLLSWRIQYRDLFLSDLTFPLDPVSKLGLDGYDLCDSWSGGLAPL